VHMDAEEPVTYKLELISQDATYTQQLGRWLGELLHGGELLLLDGQLGAGKTTFTQGLAQGMHISAVVNSPTFTLLKEYKREKSVQALDVPHRQDVQAQALYHFDLYRLDEPEEMLELGFEEYFYGSGVCVVEWADKAHDFWPVERLSIHLKALDEMKRELLFIATGSRYCELLQQFQKKTYATISS
jgi:tRNA threonylcarbamoyladenosine biosynthesis protein TsaE